MTDVLDLTVASTLALTDVVYVVVDPGGTPLDRQATLTTLADTVLSRQLVFVQTSVATVDNSAAELTMIGSGSGSLVFPANYFSAGKTIRVHAAGTISDTGTPNFTCKVKFGSTVLATTGAVAQGTLASDLWTLDWTLTCVTAGASGAVWSQGVFYSDTTRHNMVNAATIVVDTTGTLTLNVTGQWDAADPANAINTTLLQVYREN